MLKPTYVMGFIWLFSIALCLLQASAQTNTSSANFELVASYGGCIFYVDDGLLFKDKTSCEWQWEPLDLSNKGITVLSPGVLQGVWTSSVILSNNNIMALPSGAFEGLLIDGTLDLRSNNISSISVGAFQNMRTALELSVLLSFNKITTLSSGMFSGLENSPFLHLNLSHNNISHIETGFCKGMMPAKLDLSNNYISVLYENVFQGCWPIQEINLSHNYISTLSIDIFQGLWRLRVLSLHNNSIATLPFKIFQGLQLDILTLGGNPLLQCLPSSIIGAYVYVSAPIITSSTSNYIFSKGQELDLPICQEDNKEIKPVAEKIKPKFIQVDAQRFAYQKCIETRSWEAIVNYYKNFRDYFSTGGLGGLSDDVFDSWACFSGHPCLSELGALSPTDAMCYVYNEIDGTWFPWGIKSEIGDHCALGA